MMKPSLRSDRGFTLPEVLIALMLTIIMTGAALTTMLQTNRTALGATVMTDVNQNLRVSMNLLIRDMLQAGYQIPVGGIPFATGAGAMQVLRPGPENSNLTFSADYVTIPSVTPGPDLGALINGVPTDIVTVLRLDSALPWEPTAPLVDVIATDGSAIQFPAAFPIGGAVNGIKPGDLIMLGRKTLMEVTSVAGQRVYFDSTAPSKLNQYAAPQGSISQLAAVPGGPFPNAAPFTQLSAERVQMITYYLDNSGPAPTLMRRINYGPERKIAVGIENLQLTWDLVDGVTNPSNVDEPEDPNTPHQIRKANLHMAARTFDRSSTGTYLRSNLNTQVALRSLAFVDRYK